MRARWKRRFVQKNAGLVMENPGLRAKTAKRRFLCTVFVHEKSIKNRFTQCIMSK
jgi:hypothetical protein